MIAVEGGDSKNKILKRASILCCLLSALFVFLIIRILFIQVFHYKEYEEYIINQITQRTTVSAKRGEIYDTNGNVLATDITTYRLFVDPAVIASKSSDDKIEYKTIIAQGLSDIEELELEYGDVLYQIENYTKYRDRTLKRHLTEEQADLIRAFIDENGLEKKGFVYLQTTSKRYYPYSTLACHALGFTNYDGNGTYGIEAYYNDYLSGVDGAYVTARDTHGNEMPYDYESYIPAIDGYNIVTTIDIYIQAELESQLEQTYKESGGQNRACGMVMDVNTGAILAMAVYPPYDLNNPSELDWQSAEKLATCGYELGSDEYIAEENLLRQKMWNNKLITEPYMPGSTFKVITSTMAYEENLVKENEHFNCPGYWVVNGTKIHCHLHRGHGSLTYARGLQQSCNPVLMQMGLRIGAYNFFNYFSSYGYMDKTGIDLYGEANSIFWDEKTFYGADIYLATASFGQNFKITALQHLSAISAVANGGYLITPHLIKEITDSDGNVVFSYEPEVKCQVISETTSRKVSQILAEGVATDGGSRAAYVAGYKVAAKTGTSEKMDEVGADQIRKYICSAVSYAPYDNPQIASLIMVDEPTQGVLYASTIAAPYISNLMAMALPYYGVEAEYSDEEMKKLTITTPNIPANMWSVSFATQVAESCGFEVEIIGDGNIVRGQSPAAGTQLSPGKAKIYLYTTNEAAQNKKTTTVPSIIGSTAVAANATLANYGLNIKITGTNNYLSGTDAVVAYQYPAAGTEVEYGTVVTAIFRYKSDIIDDDGIYDDYHKFEAEGETN